MKNILNMFSNKKEIEMLRKEVSRLTLENIILTNKLSEMIVISNDETIINQDIPEQGIEFINKCTKIHNNRYDYSLVDYVNTSTNVKIICPVHGEFEQRPSNHIQGKGCMLCGNTRKGGHNKIVKIVSVKSIGLKNVGVKTLGTKTVRIKRLANFISVASKVHTNKYDYSLVNYGSSRDKVKIICPIHGEFTQRPGNHMDGQECPKCAMVTRLLTRSLNKKNVVDNNQQKLDLKFDDKETLVDEHQTLGDKSKKPINHDVIYTVEFLDFLNEI